MCISDKKYTDILRSYVIQINVHSDEIGKRKEDG